MSRMLVTGGAGFIGANFVHLLLEESLCDQVIVVDSLTYSGNLANLASVNSDERFVFRKVDITDKDGMAQVFDEFDIDVVFHFAAESHVDRSITDSRPFVLTNVLGTQVLLDLAKQYQIARYIQVSTDEVYGTLGKTGEFVEDMPLMPNSPYSASKASADLMVRSYFETFQLPVLITRCSNNYGPYQFPEKLIPLMITNALGDQPLPVYGKGDNVRDWIHVKDHCKGIFRVYEAGKLGEVYNLGGASERSNIEIVSAILKELGKPESLITYVADRLGHDFRYAIDFSKATRELGWTPEVTLDQGLPETVQWYLDNRDWWESVKSGDYMDYYRKQYQLS